MSFPHLSVLLNDVLFYFKNSLLKTFVDGTLGAGGHAEAILKNHPEIQTFVGIDQDPLALNIAKQRLEDWKNKTTFISGNFENLARHLDSLKLHKVDGIILDLGVSSMQFDLPEKGFSFMREGPLDMRMNPQDDLTAEEIINTWSEERIGYIFREYGEEKQWRAAAKTIIKARENKHISTTLELAEVLNPIFAWKKKGINPLTLIFQALRICVNRELEVLERVLPEAIEKLSPGGRLAVISFHSLEDRIVKNCFRFSASDKYDTVGIGGVFLDKEPLVKILTKKPITPSDQEIEINPRCRSAKLRVIEKI